VTGLRVGCGYDVHRLESGRPLVLGGVVIPHGRGLVGHSDGDCLSHAVCDALLGAAGAGDMGAHFPSSDSRWRGADSRIFLREVAALLRRSGYAIVNVDATIVAQEPRLERWLEAMRGAVAASLEASTAVISVKAKSQDGLGALGRGEGIAAVAVALVRRSARRASRRSSGRRRGGRS
jgi:2-C-methyl-D-erythritol 2,4-cyclodiphosphate synthase